MMIDILSFEDRECIFELECEVFDEVYSVDTIQKYAFDEDKVGFVIRQGKVIIAYILASYVLDECELDKIAVREDCRSNGYGSELIARLVTFCKEKNIVKINLEVREGNTSAERLYQKQGFELVGRRKKYYRHTFDALLYTLNLI